MQRRVIILFGPPGSGKGTLSPTLQDSLKMPVLSTGHMLRQAVADKTALGVIADSIMQAGDFVPDHLVVQIIKERISHGDCADGVILDGFPRTVEQARALDEMLHDHEQQHGSKWAVKVFALEAPDEVLHARIAGRWVHEQSGRSYHLKFAPPRSLSLALARKKEAAQHNQDQQLAYLQPQAELMLDDETGQPLFRRPDDTAAALQRRLDSYRRTTLPILDHYADSRPGSVVNVNANRAQSDTQVELLSML